MWHVDEVKDNNYRRIKVLKEGGFGRAWLAEDLKNYDYCVIKETKTQNMKQSDVDEIRKEAEILKVLEHPNIIRFRDIYMNRKLKLCIVMDFADSGDLYGKIEAAKEYFPETEIVDMFTQLCLAVKHIHDRKIVHRDLKSQNIFLTRMGIVKLGDFGISRVLSHTHDMLHSFVGTWYYISPEIIKGHHYSFKTDIWSLGVILYEMCALKLPFRGQNQFVLQKKITECKYSPLPNRYSDELKRLVDEILVTDPHQRPSIYQILAKPVINRRISGFLNEKDFEEEFSHTVLHNHNVMYQPPQIPAVIAPPKRAESPLLPQKPAQKASSYPHQPQSNILSAFQHAPMPVRQLPSPIPTPAVSKEASLQHGLHQIMQKADQLLEYGNNVINKIDKADSSRAALLRKDNEGGVSTRGDVGIKVVGRKVEQYQQISRQVPGVSASEAKLDKLRRENDRFKGIKASDPGVGFGNNHRLGAAPNELGLKFHLERAGSAGAFGGIAGQSPASAISKQSPLDRNYDSPANRHFFEPSDMKDVNSRLAQLRKPPQVEDDFSNRIGQLYDKLKELPARLLNQPPNLPKAVEDIDEDFPLEERIKEIDQLHNQRKSPSHVRGEVIFNKYKQDFDALKENYKRAVHIRPEEYSADVMQELEIRATQDRGIEEIIEEEEPSSSRQSHRVDGLQSKVPYPDFLKSVLQDVFGQQQMSQLSKEASIFDQVVKDSLESAPFVELADLIKPTAARGTLSHSYQDPSLAMLNLLCSE